MDKFYRVNGSSTQNKGVLPDITLPALVDPTQVGESTNDTALPWDEIPHADYSVLNSGLDKALPQLDGRCTAPAPPRIRTGACSWTACIRWKPRRAETSVSLVLTERQKQQAEDDARRLALATPGASSRACPGHHPGSGPEAAQVGHSR